MSNKADFEKATKYKLGRSIYSGDGEIFQIKGSPSKLVKIVEGDTSRFKKIEKICKARNSSVVKIYDYGIYKNSYGGNSYFYVMQKLKPLPYTNDVDYLIDLIDEFGWTRKVPFFISDKLKNFLLQSKKLRFKHRDIHAGNIMLDRYGNFKFVDLESFTY